MSEDKEASESKIQLTYKSIFETLRRDGLLELQECGSENFLKNAPGRRCLFLSSGLAEVIDNLDDTKRKGGKISEYAEVTQFLDAYVAGKDIENLSFYGSRPPLKRLNRNGNWPRAVWEVRLTSFRFFGWWAAEGILVLVTGGHTDDVHAEGPQSHDRLAQDVCSWREKSGYSGYVWNGRAEDLPRALQIYRP